MNSQKERLYYKKPKKYILIFGTSEWGPILEKVLNNKLKPNQINTKFHQELDLPKIQNKSNFMDKAYNPDKTLTNNLRFGILPLNWLWKYNREKPAVIIFLINTEKTDFETLLMNLVNTYSEHETYIKKNKIKCLYIIHNRNIKREEDKNLLKQTFKVYNKNVCLSRDEEFKDVLKDIENFILNYSSNFYEHKISRYKDNLMIGSAEHIRFQEYYLRNLIKISFMNFFLNKAKKAEKYFEKGLELCYKLLNSFKRFCEQNFEKEPKDFEIRFFYYIQKCEEIKRISNLCQIWIIFLKFKDKEIHYSDLYKMTHQHLVEMNSQKIWYLSQFHYFDNLWKIHYLDTFLRFFWKNMSSQKEINFKMNFMNTVQNLLSLNIEFLKNVKTPLKQEKIEFLPFSYGILIEKETCNLDRDKIEEINIKIKKNLLAYELDNLHFIERSELITKILEVNFEEKYEKLFNIIIFLRDEYINLINNRKKNDDLTSLILIKIFQNFDLSRKKCLQIMQRSNINNVSFLIKEMIEYNTFDKVSFENLLNDKNISEIKIDVNSNGFELIKIFESNKIDNFQKIKIDFKLKIEKSFFIEYISKIFLRFNNNYYNKFFEKEDFVIEEEDNHCFLSINKIIKSHNPIFSESSISLQAIKFSLRDKIQLRFENKLPLNRCNKKLYFFKKDILSIKNDLNKVIYLNNEFIPINFELDNNLSNFEDYDIEDIEMKIIPYNPKKTIKSFKIYREIKNGEENKLELISEKKFPENQKFVLTKKKTAEKQIVKYYIKIKLTADSIIEIDFLFSIKITSKSSKISKIEKTILKNQLNFKCSFYISKNQQNIQQNIILDRTQKESDKYIQKNTPIFINFYLKANHNSLQLKNFSILKNKEVEILEKINPFESQLTLKKNEGTNLGFIFKITKDVKNYNIADLQIEWKREESQYFTNTPFKDLLKVESYNVPFEFYTFAPLCVGFCEKFRFVYRIENKSEGDLKVFVVMSKESKLLVGGMLKTIVFLGKGESKEVTLFLIARKTGVIHLPDFKVFIQSPVKVNYLIKSSKKVYADYVIQDN